MCYPKSVARRLNGGEQMHNEEKKGKKGNMKRSLLRIPTNLDTRVSRESICGLKVNVQSVVTERYLEESHTEMFEVL